LLRFFFVGLITLLSTDYVLVNLDEAEFARLKSEIRQQRNDLQQLVAGLERLQRDMSHLAQNDAKVRFWHN
jgi:small-conductance mechanosensitive channel